MAGSWEDSEPEAWSDRDAWRGDLYFADDSTCRPEQSPVWEEVDATEEEEWPENLAGPEYWMFKKREE